MQTFLPYADFASSASVLDSPRLGKQRVETVQILRALELPEYGWASHPAVRMWAGRTPALVVYGLEVVRAWRGRGHADTTDELIAEFAPEAAGWTQADLGARGLLPAWLDDERVIVSHRSALVRKDPGRYRPLFRDVPDDLEYFWPGADPTAPPVGRPEPDLWVVRAPTPGWRELFMAAGFVALGTQAGIDADVTTLDEEAVRAALAAAVPRRRPGKDLRQLRALADDVRRGDPVALVLEGGRELALGEVTDDYRYAGGAELPHVRPVRWHASILRAAVRPPATLQDPRRLFRVTASGASAPSPPAA